MYPRTDPDDRKKYLTTEDEAHRIEAEWEKLHQPEPERTPEQWEQLFSMPLKAKINKSKRQDGKPRRHQVRWVLGPWYQANCRRIAGRPSCHNCAGACDSWDDMPAVPMGEVGCTSDEFVDWADPFTIANEQAARADGNTAAATRATVMGDRDFDSLRGVLGESCP